MDYEVKVRKVYKVILKITADAPWDAKEKANQIIKSGCYPDGSPIPQESYEYTMEPVHWGFWEI
jgi:hypothetical protein